MSIYNFDKLDENYPFQGGGGGTGGETVSIYAETPGLGLCRKIVTIKKRLLLLQYAKTAVRGEWSVQQDKTV